MLVLTREKGMAIRVGEVKITVVEVRKGKVRIGIEAPSEMPVHREEVYQALQREGREFIRPGLSIKSLHLAGIDPDATDALLQRDGLLPQPKTDQEKST
jgi:carbon storage regulator